MRHIVNPQQGKLFDPFDGLIPPLGMERIRNGWQGIFRSTLLELMPAKELAKHFDPIMGRPTKELYSVAGLLFYPGIQELDHPPGRRCLSLSHRCAVRSQSRTRHRRDVRTHFRTLSQIVHRGRMAGQVMDQVTSRLIDLLEIDVRQQRLDSTHVFSNMASFGRTRLMAVTIKRFLTQVKRHHLADYDALPEELRQRYARGPVAVAGQGEQGRRRPDQEPATGGRGSAHADRPFRRPRRPARPAQLPGPGQGVQRTMRDRGRQDPGSCQDRGRLPAKSIGSGGDV